MEIPLFSVYSFYHTLTGFNFLLLVIGDLDNVATELKDFKKSDWKKFGLKAGLSNTLDEIEANNTKVEDRFLECLFYWLRRKDKVDDKGRPSWRRLVEILEELGDRALADEIRGRKGKLNLLIIGLYYQFLGVSSDINEEQQVEPVTAPGPDKIREQRERNSKYTINNSNYNRNSNYY